MPQFGVDYANTDVIKDPDFAKAKSAGTKIIIPRAIFGGTTLPWKDPYWTRDKDKIIAAGLIRSAYLFVTVPTRATPKSPSPKEQVAAFVNYVGSDLKAPVLPTATKPREMNLVPFFDVEMESTLKPDDYYNWILEVATGLRAYYGAWPGMYTSARVWIEIMKGHAAGKLINCPLWLAKPWPWDVRQPVRFTGMPSHPTLIPQWDNQWLIYQYAGDALGYPGIGPGAVDTNTINLVKEGASGGMVRWIQSRLGELVVDGVWGPATTARMKQVQGCYGLTADSLAGADTLTLLTWLNPAPL